MSAPTTINVTAVTLWRDGGWQTFPLSDASVSEYLQKLHDAGRLTTIHTDVRPAEPQEPLQDVGQLAQGDDFDRLEIGGVEPQVPADQVAELVDLGFGDEERDEELVPRLPGRVGVEAAIPDVIPGELLVA